MMSSVFRKGICRDTVNLPIVNKRIIYGSAITKDYLKESQQGYTEENEMIGSILSVEHERLSTCVYEEWFVKHTYFFTAIKYTACFIIFH